MVVNYHQLQIVMLFFLSVSIVQCPSFCSTVTETYLNNTNSYEHVINISWLLHYWQWLLFISCHRWMVCQWWSSLVASERDQVDGRTGRSWHQENAIHCPVWFYSHTLRSRTLLDRIRLPFLSGSNPKFFKICSKQDVQKHYELLWIHPNSGHMPCLFLKKIDFCVENQVRGKKPTLV